MSSKIQNAVWENVKAVIWAVVLVSIVKVSIVEAYKVPTGSMEDTILVGDFLMANKFVYGARVPFTDWRLPAISDIKQGDVVVFRYPLAPDTNYIKRCVALPGQVVEIKDKALFVDGVRFPDPPHLKYTEPIIPRSPTGGDSPDNFGPYKVPKDCYFMMGDNRDRSYDSRYWGPVHKDLILGEAMFIHWSWIEDPDSPEVSAADPLSPPRLFLYNTFHFFERVRWSRLLNIIG